MGNLMIRPDPNQLRYNAILLLPKDGNPNYYETLFHSARNLFFGMGRPDLARDLDLILYEKVERYMGVPIHYVLMIYKNQTDLKGIFRSRNPVYAHLNIYKYDIRAWLHEIDIWINEKLRELEPEIRFTMPMPKYF